MPIAKNGAVDVFYEITGNGEPLVLIMGLGGRSYGLGETPRRL